MLDDQQGFQDRTNIVQIEKMQKHIFRCVSSVSVFSAWEAAV